MRRNKMQCQIAILEACTRKSKLIDILCATRINASQINALAQELVEKGFLELTEEPYKTSTGRGNKLLSSKPVKSKRRCKRFYSITEKGKAVVQAYWNFLRLWELNENLVIMSCG